MEITKAEFKTSFASLEQYLTFAQTSVIPEICLTGRSNVGKSSFINSLTGKTKLARTSSAPGRTRLINLFEINGGLCYFVDLPGYGYAEASKSERRGWGALIEGYLTNSRNLTHVFSLTDIRHEPTVLDAQMLGYLFHYGLPFTVVASKSDKLSKAEVGRAVQQTATTLKIGRDNVIAYSSQTNFGRDKVLLRMEEVLAQKQ